MTVLIELLLSSDLSVLQIDGVGVATSKQLTENNDPDPIVRFCCCHVER